jgi:threonine dehydrogenase-like Zn-dependent dehydrogenase
VSSQARDGADLGVRWLDADQVSQRIHVPGCRGAQYTPHCARLHPAKLVRGLARAVEGLGGRIVEQTTVTELRAHAAVTTRGTARAQTVRSARVFGRACFVGEGGTVTLEPSPDIIHRHLTLYGSWTFSTVGLSECAQFAVDRQIPIERLITHRYRLDQADEAFRTFDAGATGKCVFEM